MKTYDKSLQRKTIEFTAKEVEKALIYYLENNNRNKFTRLNDEDIEEEKEDLILMGENTSVGFGKDTQGNTTATIITYY